MFIVVDTFGTIHAVVESENDLEWGEGYGLAPDGVSILGGKDKFQIIETDDDKAAIGNHFVDGKVVVPVLPEPDPPKPPEATYSLYKTDIISRLTDAELETFVSGLNSAPIREKLMWENATYISSADPFFASLKEKLTAAFGADRAKVLLAA